MVDHQGHVPAKDRDVESKEKSALPEGPAKAMKPDQPDNSEKPKQTEHQHKAGHSCCS